MWSMWAWVSMTASILDDLGVRDTFPFEERTFMRQAITAIEADAFDTVRAIVLRRRQSVWRESSGHQNQWELVRLALDLVETCGTLEEELSAQAKTQAGLNIDQLFVNGQRQHMARYPNYNPDIRPLNGFSADAFSPERTTRWKNPAGGYIHAMHASHWGGYH